MCALVHSQLSKATLKNVHPELEGGLSQQDACMAKHKGLRSVPRSLVKKQGVLEHM